MQSFLVGQGDFHAVGAHLANLLINVGGLQPDERLLDVACGIGRAAVPLTRHLTSGSYEGFDINAAAIAWCNDHIHRAHPNFGFTLVDVFSNHYNRDGAVQPEDFVFPAPDGTFDVVALFSILTHLQPAAAARYIAEASRVLRPGGRAIMTWFLLNDATRDAIRKGKTDKSFSVVMGEGWAVESSADPEAAIAYDQSAVESALLDRGLMVTKFSRGRWTGDAEGLTYQDLVIAGKAH